MWQKSPSRLCVVSASLLKSAVGVHSASSPVGIEGVPSAFQRRVTVTRRRERELTAVHGPAWRYLQPQHRHRHTTDLKAVSPAAAPGGGGCDDAVAAVANRVANDPLHDVSFRSVLMHARSMQSDPLAAFLSEHQEEGPTFVAMWTSLHRSCVHRSELSESLVTSIRSCFHRLIRSRALQAAIQLYFRLVEYGISLKRSDVVMLLSNLPYERSVRTHGDTEAADLFRDGSAGSAAFRSRKANDAAQQPCEGQKSSVTAAGCGVKANSSQSSAPPGAVCQSQPCRSVAGHERDSPALSGSREGLLPSKSQPRSSRWLQRWAAYEAAMGNMESMDAEDAGPSARPTRLDAVSDDMRTDALVQHLCLLQKATTPDSRVVTTSHRRRERGRRCSESSSYWAEALHIVATHVQRGALLDPPSARPSSVSLPKCRYLSPALARSTLAALRLAPASVVWVQALRLLGTTSPGTLSHHSVASFACSRLLTAQLPSPWNSAWTHRAGAALRASLIPALSERADREDTSTAAMTYTGRAALEMIDLLRGSTDDDPRELILGRALEFCTLASRSLFVYGFGVKTRRAQGLLREVTAPSNSEGDQPSQDEAQDTQAKHVIPLDLVDCVAALSRVMTEIIPYLTPAEISELLLGATGVATLWAMFYLPDSHLLPRELKAVLNSPERSTVSTWTVRVCLAALLSLSQRRDMSVTDTCASILKVAVQMMQHVSSTDRKRLLVPLVYRVITACLQLVVPLPAFRRGTCNFAPISSLSGPSSIAVTVECTRMVLLLSATRVALKHTRWEARRRFLWLLCSSNRSLRKEIVKQLTSTEAKRLQSLLESVETVGRSRLKRLPSIRRGGAQNAASLVQSAVTRIRRAAPLSTEDTDRIFLRHRISAAVYENVASVGTDPLRLAPCVASDIAAARGWYEALLVLGSYVMNTKPSTVPVDSFRLAMQKLIGDRGSDSSGVHHRHHTPLPQASIPTPCDLWYGAARIFWSAVDHHALGVAGTLHQNTHMVLDKLIETLLGVAMANQQPRVARQWFLVWQRSHAEHSSAAQLGSDEYLAQKLRLSVLVRERDALQQILFFWDQIAAPQSDRSVRESLLGAVAVMCSRGEWETALRHVRQRSNDSDTDSTFLLATLICLDGCPKPLSRSALQWFHHRKNLEAWGAEHSAVLLRILTRARKWQEALACFSEPRLIAAHSNCAKVLLMALRACAVGGRGEEAGRLFDLYTACAKRTPQQRCLPGILDDSDAAVDASSSEMSLAKAFFYRAVTKTKLGHSAPSEGPGESSTKKI